MKPLLLSLALFVPFALTARYYFVCETMQWCDRVGLVGATASAKQVLVLPGGDSVELYLERYAENSALPPRSATQLASLDTLSGVLAAHPDYTLDVFAPVGADEDALATGYYRDLGVARAAELGAELQRRGVANERLELTSYPVPAGEPLALKLELRPSGPEFSRRDVPDLENFGDSIALLGLRFETNSSALSPNDEFARYASDLVEALERKGGASLRLIGHTDNRAKPIFNDTLGLWRAQAVGRYLAQLGFSGPIITETRGEREPLASNRSPAGRYQNRRVEVRIETQ